LNCIQVARYLQKEDFRHKNHIQEEAEALTIEDRKEFQECQNRTHRIEKLRTASTNNLREESKKSEYIRQFLHT